MKSRISSLIAVVLMAVLAGCSTTGGKTGDATIEDRGTAAGDMGSAVTSGLGSATSFDAYLQDHPDSPLARRVIYFDYDSADIQGADIDLLNAHAAYLVDNPGQRVVLEGHTDERGTREYNIALSERRAVAVQRVLELDGVADTQITIVSYGEEKPAAEGGSEAAWRLNRRVEIVYQGQ